MFNFENNQVHAVCNFETVINLYQQLFRQEKLKENQKKSSLATNLTLKQRRTVDRSTKKKVEKRVNVLSQLYDKDKVQRNSSLDMDFDLEN